MVCGKMENCLREGVLVCHSPLHDLTLRSDVASLLSDPYRNGLWEEQSNFGGREAGKVVNGNYNGKSLFVVFNSSGMVG